MSSAVAGVLSVDIGEVRLAAELAGMGECELEHLALVVDYSVDPVILDLFLEKVQKTVLALEDALVVVHRQAGVQIAVVVEPLGDELVVEGIGAEYLLVRNELRQGSVRFIGRTLVLRDKLALLEEGLEKSAVSV